MTISIRALADAYVASVIDACADWEELAKYGPPYWRPRSPAELRRKIAATANPQPGTEYSFVVVADGVLVGECSIHGIDWRNGVGGIRQSRGVVLSGSSSRCWSFVGPTAYPAQVHLSNDPYA